MQFSNVAAWACLLVAVVTSSLHADADVDLNQQPSSVEIVLADRTETLKPSADGWAADGVEVRVRDGVVTLKSPTSPAKTIRLRWSGTIAANAQLLGDTWERAYGDLAWKPLDRSGLMPWYFLLVEDGRTRGYGVATGPAAFCSWTADAKGLELTADVRSGGIGVELGDRTLTVCTIVAAESRADELTFTFAKRFCAMMCPTPRLPKQPVYGFNDWYCSYGHSTAKIFLGDAGTIAALSPAGENRPYMVIDDGWQAGRQGAKTTDSPWDRTNEVFGSTMPDVAKVIKAMNARPGLWYRPLEAWKDCPPAWRLSGRTSSLDPSNPEVLKAIAADMTRFRGWGYELVKHDFSTWELTGRWGRDMKQEVAPDGWSFADHTKTTAEIILNFYRTLREAAGDDMLLDGCNTVSHLSAGIFELARIGDDTSGTEWSRTKEMGVNALAFRAAQHSTFYAVDADCVGLAKADAIPWKLNEQWLDLLAQSGTPLFVSWPTQLMGDEQRVAIRRALETASKARPVGEALDWMTSPMPTRWKFADAEQTFDFGE